MTEPSPKHKAWVRRGVEIAFAAVTLLALIELNGAILRQGLRLIGFGDGNPTVLGIRDGCGTLSWFPPAFRELLKTHGKSLRADCANPAEVFALVPPNRSALLFVNGARHEPASVSGRFALFSGVRLQPGINHLLAVEPESSLLFPFPIKDQGDIGPLMAATGGSDPGLLNALAIWAPHVAIVSAEAADSDLNEDARPGTRSLSLNRQPSGEIEISARSCVPERHPLAGAARKGVLYGPHFVWRTFKALIFGEPREASDPAWSETRSLVVGSGAGPDGTQCLQTSSTVPNGQVMLLAHENFPSLPGDRLALRGFKGLLTIMGRQPDETDGENMIWLGGGPARPDNTLMIIPGPSLLAGTAARIKAGHGSGSSPGFTENTLSEDLHLPAGIGKTEAQRGGLLASISDLRALLPRVLHATLWSLTTAAPVALILWVLIKRSRELEWTARMVRARAALAVIIVFAVAFAVQPLLLRVTHFLLSLTGVIRIAGLPVNQGGLPGAGAAPLAMCIVLMIAPILRSAEMPAGGSRHGSRRIISAAVSVSLALAAAVVLAATQLMLLPGIVSELFSTSPGIWLSEILPPDRRDPIVIVALAFGLWVILGLLLFWVAVYWLFRAAIPKVSVAGAAVIGGLLLFLLPLTRAAAEALAVVIPLSTTFQNWSMLALSGYIAAQANPLAEIASAALLLVIVAVTLRAFREIAAAMLTDPHARKLRTVARTSLLLIVSLVITRPLVAKSWSDPESINSTTLQLMAVFQAYGAMLALLAPLAAAQEFDRVAANNRTAERFIFPGPVVWLAAAAFAGYLTLWSREPVAVAALMLVGWITFRYALLGPEPPGPQGERELGLGKRYIDYLSECRLLRGRLSSLEKLCTEGKLSLSALATQRIEIEKVQRRIDARLGVGADTAKRLLLQYGPGQSPLQNGTRGAVAGLLMAGLMQLTLPFDFSAVRGPSETSWTALLAKMAIDPRYEVVTTSIKDSQLLMFLSELLNAAAVWTIAGFIFGYVFHRIRGQDGFVKGAVFGAGIGLPYVLSQALVSPPGGTPIAALGRMIPLLVFLLISGSLVFDGATLRREKISIAKLPELYGLKTSVGYLSFAGVVASIQPVLDLLSHALK